MVKLASATLPDTYPAMNERQRAELDAWKAAMLATAPPMDEATARRVSAALFGTHAPTQASPLNTRKAVRHEPIAA